MNKFSPCFPGDLGKKNKYVSTKMTITYLKTVSSLTIDKCVSILPENLFTKFLKGKIQR